MSFIATGPAQPPEQEVVIPNSAFFPALKLSEFRKAMRVDSVTTNDRAANALNAAAIEVNQRLTAWATQQIAQGYAQLDQLPLAPTALPEQNLFLYLRAVWSLAKANLIERYRDYDTTKTGNDKANDLEPAADDYRRDAAWAINDLVGTTRSTIELI